MREEVWPFQNGSSHLGVNPLRTGQPLYGQNWHFFIGRHNFEFGYRGQKKTDVGNCKLNAFGQESWQSVLVCSFGIRKTNKILAKNTKIIQTSMLNLSWMHFLQSPKHSCKIHRLVQIFGMYQSLVFFSIFSLRLKIVLPAPNQLWSLIC